MTGVALFRLPYQHNCSLLSGEVTELPSVGALSEHHGFVVAPFSPSFPVLLIHADRQQQYAGPHELTEALYDFKPQGQVCLSTDDKSDYHAAFSDFHTALANNHFQKLVLSRRVDIPKDDDVTPLELFRRACERYPRMFISLTYTPYSGLWLTATPEILLSGEGNRWHTMALAGTMPYADQVSWSDKNIQEQRYVATYIAKTLEQFTDDCQEEGPKTARAGHLAHLRSDFTFSLHDDTSIGQLLDALHPTPAVCGLPKHESYHFILQHEHHDRSYYSGFMGPLSVNGQTNLFVTLRCMQIFEHSYRLYAGGGLLKDSIEELEWQETETKLDTMRHIIYNDNVNGNDNGNDNDNGNHV